MSILPPVIMYIECNNTFVLHRHSTRFVRSVRISHSQGFRVMDDGWTFLILHGRPWKRQKEEHGERALESSSSSLDRPIDRENSIGALPHFSRFGQRDGCCDSTYFKGARSSTTFWGPSPSVPVNSACSISSGKERNYKTQRNARV